MPRSTKSELLDEAVRYIVETSQDNTWLCQESSRHPDGCIHDCDHYPDDGCVLHLLRMRLNKRKNNNLNQ